MEDSDVETWRAVDKGGRPISWSVILGDPDGAPYLTSAGRDLSRRMADDLTEFFGEPWLPSVVRTDTEPHKVPRIFRAAPSLALSRAAAADSFMTMLRWWASITVNKTTQRIGQVRHEVRKNLTDQRLTHSLTMLRLGAIARSCGLDVEFEPRPGDLLVSAPASTSTADTRTGHAGKHGVRSSVTIEVVALRTPRPVEAFEERTDELFAHLRSLRNVHGVEFDGQLPELDSDIDRWFRVSARAAASAARLGINIAIETDGRTLHVAPASSSNGANVEGPLLETDSGSRIQRAVRDKARQTAKASDVWLWVENQGAIDVLNTFHHLPRPQQLAAFGNLTVPALAEFENVRGLTFSTEHRHWPRLAELREATSDDATGRGRIAMDLPLWMHRTRSSLTIPTGSTDPRGTAALVRQLVAAEEGWLDWALDRLAGVRVTNLVVEER